MTNNLKQTLRDIISVIKEEVTDAMKEPEAKFKPGQKLHTMREVFEALIYGFSTSTYYNGMEICIISLSKKGLLVERDNTKKELTSEDYTSFPFSYFDPNLCEITIAGEK